MLYFISSNNHKFKNAEHFLLPLGIEIEQKSVEVDEIQATTIERVALDKADKVFEILQKPLISTDHGWFIPGLNGFPGPYMKFMNDWLTPQNFLDLFAHLEDRRILMQEVVVYRDETQKKLFMIDHHGILLNESRGDNYYPAMTIASFTQGLSVAEARDHDVDPYNSMPLWQEFADWYTLKVLK